MIKTLYFCTSPAPLLLLAQIEPDIKWPDTMKVLIGIVGLLSVVWLVLSVAIASKKLFGKHPPIQEELKAVRDEFQAADSALARRIQEETQKRETAIENINIDRARTLGQLHRKMNSINRNLYLIAGKLDITPAPNPDEAE
jgi:hypothetical protein